MNPKFNYLSPLIFPLLPANCGRTRFTLNVQNMLLEVAPDVCDGDLECEIIQYSDTLEVSKETIPLTISGGVCDLPLIDRSFAPEKLGYAQISISASVGLFRRILSEHVYAIVERPDGGTFILNAAFKFSDPQIIGLIKNVGRFCLVHPAHYVDEHSGSGNSALIVNPFEGPVVVQLATAAGTRIRKRIEPRQVELIGLEALLPHGEFACVQYTGKNRYPAWDVRHRYGSLAHVNRIDHMEYYRGDSTVQQVGVRTFIRARARQVLRAVGLRH